MASTGTTSVAAPTGIEEGAAACANGVDDDNDGFVDCEDRDCALTAPSCPGTEERCDDGTDDDGDGFVDGADDDCAESSMALCADGLDNDGDGYVDCEDFDCSQNESLPDLDCPSEDTDVKCSDGEDNDGNGYTDCEDYGCSKNESVTVCCSSDNPAGSCGPGSVCTAGQCESGCSPEHPEAPCPNPSQVCREGQCVDRGPCGPDEPHGTCPGERERCVSEVCVIVAGVSVAGDLVISEVLPDAAGNEDQQEWFEIFNPASDQVELLGLIVRDEGTDQFAITTSLVVPSQGYVVLGRSTDKTINGAVDVDYGYGSEMALANGEDEIVLEMGGVEIDRVAYSSGDYPYSAGVAMGLSPGNLDADANDEATHWCAQQSPWAEAGGKGTPGEPNEPCP